MLALPCPCLSNTAAVLIIRWGQDEPEIIVFKVASWLYQPRWRLTFDHDLTELSQSESLVHMYRWETIQ